MEEWHCGADGRQRCSTRGIMVGEADEGPMVFVARVLLARADECSSTPSFVCLRLVLMCNIMQPHTQTHLCTYPPTYKGSIINSGITFTRASSCSRHRFAYVARHTFILRLMLITLHLLTQSTIHSGSEP